jgi:hypothetical protein
MAKAKKKAAKKAVKKSAKPAARRAVKKKTIAKRKPVAATRGKSIKRAVKKKPNSRGPRRAGRAPQGVQLGVSLDLDNRLRDIATQMEKSLEEILIQALTEFADNWEDHLNTVKTLSAGDDRMQLAVRMDDDDATP